MPRLIQKIIQTHQEHTRAQQTQKNHTNPEIKHRKIIKEYCTQKKSIHIYTQTKLSKRKNIFKSENYINTIINKIPTKLNKPSSISQPYQYKPSSIIPTQSKTSWPLFKPTNGPSQSKPRKPSSTHHLRPKKTDPTPLI